MTLAQKRHATAADLCVECGKCSTLCPLGFLGDYSAARVAAIRDPDQELERRAGAVQRCLTCGLCEIRCPQGVRFSEFVRELRPQLPERLRHPCPHGEVLRSAARLMAGANGERRGVERDLSWLDDDLRIAEQGELALFVGCLPQFDVVFEQELGLRTLDIARAAIRLLNRLEIEPVVLRDEVCCGHDLLWSGDREGFEALAAANARAFEARGVKRILTTCAECCRTWRLDYPDACEGYRPAVQHLAEFIAEQLEAGQLEAAAGNGDSITYHDPCRLGRQLGVFDEPRRLLDATAGERFVEMEHCGPDAQCCGTPGFLRCDAASRALQKRKLEDAADTGVDRLLTACPKCLIHLRCAQSEDRRLRRDTPAVRVQDLTVFAAERLVQRTLGETR